jgi:DNA-binding MarR family transcriptional regulator
MENYKTYQLIALESRAHRNFRQLLSSLLQARQLTVMEWALLGLIGEHQAKGISITDLAEALQVKTALVSTMVSKQTRQGLVRKTEAVVDSRKRLVKLTQAGRMRMAETEQILVSEFRERLTSSIGKRHQTNYMTAVERLARATTQR